MYAFVSFQILPGLEGLPYIAATGLTTILVTAAFSFKLAFTMEDAPELVIGFAKTLLDTFDGQSLLFRARLVFALMAAAGGFAVYRSLTGGVQAPKSSGKPPQHSAIQKLTVHQPNCFTISTSY